MPVLNPACATDTLKPQPGTADLAERRLRSYPYLALKNIACDLLDGVLVLRGCLPTYYLKQIAQEAVASLEGIERIDNQIQVVPPLSDNAGADAGIGPAEWPTAARS